MRVEFDNEGFCTLRSEKGVELRRFATVYEPAFNHQYDQPLTEDGTRLLIGTWERGLHCYDTGSGELVWREGPGRVRELIVFDDSVVVEMYGRGVWTRELASGQVGAKVSMSGIESFFRIGRELLFAGPKRFDYLILELADLSERARIHKRWLNPEACLSFGIDRVLRSGSDVLVTGRESHPDGDYRVSSSRNFRRLIKNVLE